MKRVVILGTSGSGKTFFARELSRITRIPHIEVDVLYWGPNRTECSKSKLRALVDEKIRADAWIIEGHDVKLRDLTWAAADTIIWLDLPFHLVLTRSIKRALLRSVKRQPPWKMIWWTLKTYGARKREYNNLLASPNLNETRVIRLFSVEHVRKYLDLAGSPQKSHDNSHDRLAGDEA